MTLQQPCNLWVKVPNNVPQVPPLFPMPTSLTNGSTLVTVSPLVVMSAPTPSGDLDLAFERFVSRTFINPWPAGTTGTLTTVVVNVANVSVPLNLGVDESYTLSVPADGSSSVTLSAPTVYGAYRGLETLSQLIQYNMDVKQYQISCGPVTVSDAPAFTHRSLLIDTSRHFHSLPSLQQLIDAMEWAKFSALHWHVVDWQAFPLESKTYPQLWAGAWSPAERYTQEDVAFIVEYGRQRGIRVFPEIDTPGHAGSFCVGYPDVCPSPNCTMPLNVASEATFDLLTSLFGELTGGAPSAGLFPDEVFHLGGDEVDTSCWTQTPSINNWLNSHNLTADQGYEYFVNRTTQIALAQGRSPIVWEEVWQHFGSQLNKNIIVEAWLTTTSVQQATSLGYRAIWAIDGRWYLDDLTDTWDYMWSQDPLQGVAANATQFVIGGEACMWSETVDDSDLANTVWPRAAAVAERLWSYHTVGFPNPAVALNRIINFRCLLNRRGVGAAPVTNLVARSAPIGPGSCFWQ
jgi:hexosaminidase